MEHLYKLYNTKKEVYDKLLDSDVNISLKVDGRAFQITVLDGEVSYRKRSGTPSRPGPVIDEFSIFFSKELNDTIEFFDSKKTVLDDYSFLTFELFNGVIVLLSAVSKDGEVLSDLESIAKKLGCDVVPLLYSGDLQDYHKKDIEDYINNEITIDELLKDFNFDKNKYSKFISEDLEGIVLDFSVDNKHVFYKIVDKNFEQHIKDKQQLQLDIKEKDKENSEYIITKLFEYFELNAEKLDNNKWISLNKNFIKLFNEPKLFNDLLLKAGKLTVSNFDMLPSKMLKEIKQNYNKLGTPFRNLFELYLLNFHKEKKRNFVISKEFQTKLNSIIEKI